MKNTRRRLLLICLIVVVLLLSSTAVPAFAGGCGPYTQQQGGTCSVSGGVVVTSQFDGHTRVGTTFSANVRNGGSWAGATYPLAGGNEYLYRTQVSGNKCSLTYASRSGRCR